MAETFTLYKLIILYMLNKVDFPLTTSQISEFVLDKGYTSYFKLQEALSELASSGLIRPETTHNRTLYHLTENGAETIHYFSNKISSAIRKDIDDFLKEKQYDLKEEVAVKSDYYLNTNKEYEVRCQIVENGSSLIDLKLTVPTETEAEAIANRWDLNSQQIYAQLLAGVDVRAAEAELPVISVPSYTWLLHDDALSAEGTDVADLLIGLGLTVSDNATPSEEITVTVDAVYRTDVLTESGENTLLAPEDGAAGIYDLSETGRYLVYVRATDRFGNSYVDQVTLVVID